MSAELLIPLLAQRLPRRERCGDCRSWERDPADPEYGDCDVARAELRGGTHASEGCVYYVPIVEQWHDDPGLRAWWPETIARRATAR